jgi:transposase InsO family protein
MGGKSRWEYLRAIYVRYKKVGKENRRRILDEFCAVCGYNRKYAIRLLNGPAPEKPKKRVRHGRQPKYGASVIGVVATIWQAAGYPCSVRLKALLPLWLPWAIKRLRISKPTQEKLFTISAATMDRRLAQKKLRLKKRLYGRTKPGTLLKHHIAIKTDCWDVKSPGFNVTDIHTTWVETRAVMGKSQIAVLDAMKEIAQALPFKLLGIDSDNGSEFINHHLKTYCDQNQIQFTRGRPYKKDDNAHIEQKNYTHVRKLLGYQRYDSLQVQRAINELYRNELSLLQNLFLPSMKLKQKNRVGSKLKRRYELPRTPLERLAQCPEANPVKIKELKALRDKTDPFELANRIDHKLDRIYQLANHRVSPTLQSQPSVTRSEEQTMAELAKIFGKERRKEPAR